MDKSKLMALTMKDLRACAELLKIKRIMSLKKADLVDAIVKTGKPVEKLLADIRSEKSSAESKESAVKNVSADTTAKPVSKAGDQVKASDKAEKSSAAKGRKAASSADKKLSAKAGEVKDAESVSAELDEDGKPVIKKAEDAESVSAELDEDGRPAVKKAKKVEEPAPIEPDSIFIDHGAILPEYIPGTCLYALVRDPGTLFVYWNATFESDNGWLLTAYDFSGNILQEFKTPARRNGRGYFRVPTARVGRVTLSMITNEGGSEVKLESKIRIAQQLGIAQPRPEFDERWVDVQNRKVIYEAPAPGRAPYYDEAVQRMNNEHIAGGGYDRSFDSATANADGTIISTSSRFGSVSGAPSSDTLAGSSDRIVRR